MKYFPEYDTLVIVGSWNIAIITPEWISKYLISNEKLDLQYPMIGNASLRISTDELSLYVSQGRFNFSVSNHKDEVYLKIGKIALKLADYLMHTPVSSFGLNFVYECNPKEEIDKYFSVNDSDNFVNFGLEAKATVIKRSFEQKDSILNFTVTRDEKYKFDFNYHFNISSLVEFKDKFDPKNILALKKQSEKLLSDLYNLEME